MYQEMLDKEFLLLKLIDNESLDGGGIQFIIFSTMAHNRDLGDIMENEYNFLRTTYGPFSEPILTTIKKLISSNYLEVQSNGLCSTEKGKKILIDKEGREYFKDEKYRELYMKVKEDLDELRKNANGKLILKLRKQVFNSDCFQQTSIGEQFKFNKIKWQL